MPSFGEELRRERELREISLREVAEATKVNIRYLEAMERNDFEHLPGGVFNRGFVRAYAQYIGIDPDAMVNAYLLQVREHEHPGAGTGGQLLRGRRAAEPAPGRGKTVRSPRRRAVLRWTVLVLLVVALIAAAAIAVRLRSAPAGPTPGPVSAGRAP